LSPSNLGRALAAPLARHGGAGPGASRQPGRAPASAPPPPFGLQARPRAGMPVHSGIAPAAPDPFSPPAPGRAFLRFAPEGRQHKTRKKILDSREVG